VTEVRATLRFQAVIFDMDGVLLDSEPLHYEALSAVLAREGHEWTRKDNERLLGTTVVDSFRVIAETVPLAHPIESYIPVYDRQVLDILHRPLTPAPGALPLIRELRRLSVPMAVASSSLRSWIDATLASLGIADFFRVIVSGEDIENGKPAPDIYLRTAAILGNEPNVCLAIEDAPNGVLSAHAAGMQVVAVRTPYTRRLPLVGAALIVSSLEDLTVSANQNGCSVAVSSDLT